MLPARLVLSKLFQAALSPVCVAQPSSWTQVCPKSQDNSTGRLGWQQENPCLEVTSTAQPSASPSAPGLWFKQTNKPLLLNSNFHFHPFSYDVGLDWGTPCHQESLRTDSAMTYKPDESPTKKQDWDVLLK